MATMENVETGGSDDARTAFQAAKMMTIDNKALFISILHDIVDVA
jgi:hypothetical protein